jgi:rubrerythrin
VNWSQDLARNDLVVAEIAASGPAVTGIADLVWRCRSCGYQLEAASPPKACPTCSAGPDLFEGHSRIGWRELLAQV